MVISRPATERADLSHIAYGFMASKALFAALEIGIFTLLADRARTPAELSAQTGVASNRLRTLLHALAGLRLVVPEGTGYANAPVSQRYLVRGAPDDFGDYFRLQVGGQIYPALLHLDQGINGTGQPFDTLSGLLACPDEAHRFTVAQHVGSLAAARALADRIGLTGATRLLDVGGGSGAFSMAFCERAQDLRATVLDLPAVIEVTRAYRAEADMAGRIDLVAGDAVRTAWPDGQDVVLMSYLLSALSDKGPDSEIDGVLAKAHACLNPGGLLIIHDFMLDDPGPGPTWATLWFLQYLAYQPDAVSFSAADLGGRLRRAGFTPELPFVLVPDLTKVILARKEVSR
jgi:SAM-dependent methyltransferase